ncbi:MAG: hypothetical protein HOV83_37580 [Catenulispora sp.]|nr:hypothetical protein [Catenulispora sp.]
MRYRELLHKNAPLTLFAMSGVGVLRALRHVERTGPKWARPHRGGTYVAEINRGAEELSADPTQWPPVLTELAEHAEVRVEPTLVRPTMCLRVTARGGEGDLGRQVREAKQLLETGEVLASPALPEGDRR